MPDAFSTYTEDFILDWITGTNKYVSLHSADPGGTGTNELTGNGYARPLIAPAGWTAKSNSAEGGRQVSNVNTITFPTVVTADWATWYYIGLWDAVTAGNFILGGLFNAGGILWQVGETGLIPAGELIIIVGPSTVA